MAVIDKVFCRPVILLSLTLLAACQSGPKLVWEASGFVAPESVVFDIERNQFYVSNMGSWGKGAVPGDGFISRVSAQGRILELRWITGLENPKGLALANGRLYVGDDAELVEIDPAAGLVTARYAPEGGPGGFNDCTVDPQGRVYVFSRRLSTVYRLSDGQFEPWAKVDISKTGAPNGLHAERDRLLMGSWAVMGEDGQERPGHISTLNFADQALGRIGQPLGQIDGIEPDGRGGYTVTDWTTGKVWRVSPEGQATQLLQLSQGTADHLYLAQQNLLVIPLILDNLVRAYYWAPAARD